MKLEKETALYNRDAIKDDIQELESKIGDAPQYFWHTETDTGAGAGAHITEVPQEDFLDDPANGGGNTLIRSGGMTVRDGLTELASFGSTTYIGRKDTSDITIKLESESYTGYKDGRLAFLEWAENNGVLTPSEIGTVFCTSGSAVSDSIGLYCGQQNGSTQIDTQFEANEISALIQVTESQNVPPYADLSRSRIVLDKNEITIKSNSVDVNNVTVDSSGNIDMAGKLQSFFSIVNLEVAVGSVAAHERNNIGTVTVPSANRPDGMTLVGIVGVACNNYRVVPYNYYVNGVHSITCAVVNTTTTQSAAGTTMTFKLLYAKMASA